MNIIDLQERLKDLPETALMQEMQMPSGTAPQFLVLSELKRRKRMRDEYQRQQAQGMQTVAEETITAAGMPQQGIMGLAQGMAPKSAIAQDTGVNDMMQQESVRAPQPEQPMMMAEGGVVKMQPGGDVRQAVDNLLDRNRLRGGFGDNVEYDYAAFLQEMGLSDTPDARDTFRRYQERMNAQFALEGPNTDPRLFGPEGQRMFLRDIDEDRYAGPGQPSIADVSTDLDVFMPGGVGQSPMMAAPPALGAAPSVGTVDFDASVAAAPAAPPMPEPEGPYTDALRNYLSGFRGDRGLSRPFEADPLDPRSPSYASVAETAPALEPETDEAYLGRLMERADARSVRARLAAAPSGLRPVPTGEGQLFDPEASPLLPQAITPGPNAPPSGTDLRGVGTIIGEAISGEDPKATADRLMTNGQINQDQYNRYIFGSSGERNEIIREALGYQEPQVAPNAVDAVPTESIVEDAQLPRPVEDQGLSFGLDGLNIPGSGTPLSFGGVTPSAADIPLSTGEAATGEPTPEFPLGTPATVPGTQPVADRTGGGGTGGGGAGDFGPIESRIARMLEERERSAEADKWLALAQTGLALMASDQPTIGGAIGEAGLAGIGALQQARSQYDKDIMSLLDMQAGIQRARAAGARSARTDGLTASNIVSLLNNATDESNRIAIELAKITPDMITGELPPEAGILRRMLVESQLQIREYKNLLNRRSGSTGVESEADYNAAAS
jgi:hypothetical protein